MSSVPPIGQHNATVLGLTLAFMGNKPAIFTRLSFEEVKPADPLPDGTPQVKTLTHTVAHAVRLSEKTAARIGLDELRGAFPKELGTLDDKALLAYLLTKTSSFDGRSVVISIETQMKNGIPVKSDSGETYYNIRLRSALRDMDEQLSLQIAERVLSLATAPVNATSKVFDEVTT